MKLKHLLYLILALPLFWGCNNEDNVEEIFASGTWNVGNFYNGGDWNKLNDGARPKYTQPEDLKALNFLTVTFMEDGTISGRDFWTTGVRCGYLGNGHDDNYHVCYTMWKFELPDPNTKVMVVARDRWGNEYTQTEFQVGTEFGYAIYDENNNPK